MCRYIFIDRPREKERVTHRETDRQTVKAREKERQAEIHTHIHRNRQREASHCLLWAERMGSSHNMLSQWSEISVLFDEWHAVNALELLRQSTSILRRRTEGKKRRRKWRWRWKRKRKRGGRMGGKDVKIILVRWSNSLSLSQFLCLSLSCFLSAASVACHTITWRSRTSIRKVRLTGRDKREEGRYIKTDNDR